MARRESDIQSERERQIRAGREAVKQEELAKLADVVARLEDVDLGVDVDDREIRELVQLGRKGFNGGE